MGFIRLKLKKYKSDTIYDTFINTDAIEFISEYFGENNNDYIMTTEIKFHQPDGAFWCENYIIIGETMESIAKKLGLEEK